MHEVAQRRFRASAESGGEFSLDKMSLFMRSNYRLADMFHLLSRKRSSAEGFVQDQWQQAVLPNGMQWKWPGNWSRCKGCQRGGVWTKGTCKLSSNPHDGSHHFGRSKTISSSRFPGKGGGVLMVRQDGLLCQRLPIHRRHFAIPAKRQGIWKQCVDRRRWKASDQTAQRGEATSTSYPVRDVHAWSGPPCVADPAEREEFSILRSTAVLRITSVLPRTGRGLYPPWEVTLRFSNRKCDIGPWYFWYQRRLG